MTIKNLTNKILYKFTLRDRVLERNIKIQSSKISESLIKVYLWRDTYNKSRWSAEIYGFLHKVEYMRKLYRYPTKSDLYRWLWEDGSRDSIFNDMISVVHLAGIEYSDYKYLKKPKDVMYKEVRNFVDDYMKWLSKSLSSRGSVSAREVQEQIELLLRKYPYNDNKKKKNRVGDIIGYRWDS